MGQVDAGAENAATPILLVFDGGAPHHRDMRCAIKRSDIDRDFGLCERRIVLRVEKAGIDHVEMHRFAPARQSCGAKIERAL